MDSTSPAEALQRAIQVVGTQQAFATALGVTQSAVGNWISRRRPAPAERVLDIERITGVSRHDLRPDLYPRENAA